tara:strand:- start:259 stop:753 length:495 start_codon:yes stop_codon:yes gene_type:complete
MKKKVLTNSISKKVYRKGVGMMLLNKKGKIFVGQRFDKDKAAWQMPQGGIDKGESSIIALKRELEEETGINSNFEIIKKSHKKYKYDLPLYLQKKLWRGKFKGQEQIWFLIRFLGNDNEINIKTKKPEFKKWMWVSTNELMKIIVPFKKELYANVLEEFKEELI